MKEKIDNITSLIAKLSLPLLAFSIPIFFLPFTADPFTFNKRFLVFVAVTVLLVSWVIRLLFHRRVVISVGPATYPFLLLSGVFILSSLIQSPTPYLSLLGKTSSIVALTLLFVIATTVNKNNSLILPTLLGLSSSVTLLSIISLLGFIGINIPFVPNNLSGDAISLFALLIPLIPLFIALGLNSKELSSKLSFFVAAALSLSASAAQFSILFIQKSQTPLLLPIQAGWAIAVDIFKSGRSAFLGVGPENFISAFTRLRPISLNSNPLYWNLRFTYSSNEFLDVLTTTGILGFILFFLIFYKTIKIVLKERLSSKGAYSRPLLIGLISLIISYLVVPASFTSLFVATILLVLITLNLKTLTDSTYNLALSLFAVKVITRLDSKQEESLSSGQSVFMWIFSLALVSPVVFFWVYASRSYLASIYTQIAAKTLATNSKVSYEKQIQAYNLEPQNPIYRINFAQTSIALANSLASKPNLSEQDRTTITQLVQQAIRESKNAANLSPTNISTWENLAVIYKQLLNFADGSVDWAIATYNQAIAIDPSNPSLRLDLGGVFYARGDYDNAIRLFGQAADLKPDWPNAHYNLASAYKAKKDYIKAVSAMEQVVKLLKPEAADYQKAKDELESLKAMVPKSSTPTTTTETPSDNNIQLVTPTPIAKNNNKIVLPKESAPSFPPPAGGTPATSSANPQ